MRGDRLSAFYLILCVGWLAAAQAREEQIDPAAQGQHLRQLMERISREIGHVDEDQARVVHMAHRH